METYSVFQAIKKQWTLNLSYSLNFSNVTHLVYHLAHSHHWIVLCKHSCISSGQLQKLHKQKHTTLRIRCYSFENATPTITWWNVAFSTWPHCQEVHPTLSTLAERAIPNHPELSAPIKEFNMRVWWREWNVCLLFQAYHRNVRKIYISFHSHL